MIEYTINFKVLPRYGLKKQSFTNLGNFHYYSPKQFSATIAGTNLGRGGIHHGSWPSIMSFIASYYYSKTASRFNLRDAKNFLNGAFLHLPECFVQPGEPSQHLVVPHPTVNSAAIAILFERLVIISKSTLLDLFPDQYLHLELLHCSSKFLWSNKFL